MLIRQIDLEDFMEHTCAYDVEYFDVAIAGMLDELRLRLRELDAFLKKKEYPNAKIAAHTIKTLMLTMGCRVGSEIAREIELSMIAVREGLFRGGGNSRRYNHLVEVSKDLEEGLPAAIDELKNKLWPATGEEAST